MNREPDQIVFQDLNGNPDPETDLEVDLDSETPGITRKPAKASGGDDDAGAPANARGEDQDYIIRGDTDEGQGGEDDDKAARGRRNEFEARLERERRAKRRERQRAEALEAENARLKQRLEKARASSVPSKEQIESQIASTESLLEAAIEKGDTKEQVKLTSTLTDLKARRIAAEYGPPPDDDDEPTGGTDVKKAGQNELVEEWKERHADWYKRPGFEKQTRLANKIDREIFAEGYEVDDPDYYKELDKRLRKAAPEVFDAAGDGGEDGQNGREGRMDRRGDRGRSPVAPAHSGAGAASLAAKRGKVELDRDDFANMRRFGLDPNKPEVLKEYARNKRQRLLEESA